MYSMLLTGTKVKSSDSVEIKPNRRASEKQDDVKLEKKGHKCQPYSIRFSIPFVL